MEVDLGYIDIVNLCLSCRCQSFVQLAEPQVCTGQIRVRVPFFGIKFQIFLILGEGFVVVAQFAVEEAQITEARVSRG